MAPAAGLFLLAPLVGEYLLGNVSITEIGALPFLALLYGGGALLIRELARRRGRGWPTMLTLGLAYGLLECSLIDQTLFHPPVLAGTPSGSATDVPALGLSAGNALTFVVGHAVWSIGVPIAIVETFVPDRRTIPWLGSAGLAVAGGLYLLGATVIFRFMQRSEHFLAPAPRVLAVAVVAAGLIGLALGARGRRGPAIGRPAPSPRLVGPLAFVASSLFATRAEGWPGLAFGVALAATAAVVVARWSRREGWGAAHRVALAGGALLTYAWLGFVLTGLLGRAGAIHLLGNALFAAGAVALLIVATRTARRAGSAQRTTG